MAWELKYLLVLLAGSIAGRLWARYVGPEKAAKVVATTPWIVMPVGFAVLAAPAVILLWVLGA